MKRTIRLKESDLHQIITESVNRVLNEWTEEEILAARKQAKMVKDAIAFVRNLGFETSDYDSENMYQFNVYNVDLGKAEKIAAALNNYFGFTSEYECARAEMRSNLFQTFDEAIIKLPAYTHATKLKESIEIKPENKGKFNATKKRTGKSTEELTHSKNPLTRKRAIFAQNAKKWNHKGK